MHGWLAPGRADMVEKPGERKAAHLMTAKKKTEEGGVVEEDNPFHVTPTVA